MSELLYKKGDKVYITPEWEVVTVDPNDKDLPYRIKTSEGISLWFKESVLSPIKPQETGKVELTEEEAEFLESFEGDRSEALYNIANYGWGYGLLDGNGDPKESLLPSTSFEHKCKLLNALINGYTVAKEL